MRATNRRSLQRKLLGVMLLTTLVALVVALGAMIAYDLRAYHRGWIERHRRAGRAARAHHGAGAGLRRPDAWRGENLALLRQQPKMRAAAIYTARGALFATYRPDAEQRPLPPLPEADGAQSTTATCWCSGASSTTGEILGTVYLRADYELDDRVLDYAGIAARRHADRDAGGARLSRSGCSGSSRGPSSPSARSRATWSRSSDYSRRAEKISDDEVGVLVDVVQRHAERDRAPHRRAGASNRQRARGRASALAQQEVMRLNAELEQRVHERTAQLERSNRELALATAAAEQANRAKSEFLSSMSHELRTPLNAIIGFGQLLAADTSCAPREEQKRTFVDHILKSGKHLLTLINEILTWRRSKPAAWRCRSSRWRWPTCFDDCRAMTQPLAAQRGIRMLLPAACRRCRCVADRTRLKQVLLNLLSNAVKYNRDNGAVVVELRAGGRPGARVGAGHRPRLAPRSRLRRCSSPSTASARKPGRRKAPASAWSSRGTWSS